MDYEDWRALMDPRAIEEGHGSEQDSRASSARKAGRKPSCGRRRPSLRNEILKGRFLLLVSLLVISCLPGTAHSQGFGMDNIILINTNPYHYVPHHGAILRAQEGVTLFPKRRQDSLEICSTKRLLDLKEPKSFR